MRIAIASLLLLGLYWGSLCEGADAEPPKARREINFEGEIVEGAARQSLDSLTQTSGGSKKNNTHLYDKREKVQDRNPERVREIIETY